VAVGGLLLDVLLLFLFLGAGACFLGIAVESAVRAGKLSTRSRTVLGAGSLLAYLILVIPVSIWVGCGEGCIVDPSPLVGISPLQLVGWFAGRFLARRFGRTSSAETDNANPSY
jgi:hypothetical protein